MVLIDRRALLAAALALAAGCAAHPAPVIKVPTPMPTALCLVLTRVSGGELLGAGPGLTRRVEQTLTARDLVPQPVGPEQFAEPFRARRTPQQRLDWLAQAQPEAPLLVLVEAEVEYYSQISGRFRWTVNVRVSVMPRGQPEQLVQSEFSVPVALQFQHEREPEALEEAAPVVERQVAQALDLLLGGLQAL